MIAAIGFVMNTTTGYAMIIAMNYATVITLGWMNYGIDNEHPILDI